MIEFDTQGAFRVGGSASSVIVTGRLEFTTHAAEKRNDAGEIVDHVYTGHNVDLWGKASQPILPLSVGSFHGSGHNVNMAMVVVSCKEDGPDFLIHATDDPAKIRTAFKAEEVAV